MGSIFRRKYTAKKTGEEKEVRKYSMRFKNANGKWITRSSGETKKYLAERKLHEREAEVAQWRKALFAPIAPPEEQDAYLEEIKTAYLADRKIRVRHGTYQLYQERLDFTLADLGCERVSQLTLEAIDSYVDRRLDRDVSPRTINIQMTIMRRMIAFALDREWPGVVRNTLKRWHPLREVPQTKRRALVPDEVQRLFENAPVHRRVIWAVALASGLRRKELVGMEVDDVDIDHGLLIVQPNMAKSGRRRVVPMPSELIELLRQWIDEDLPRRHRLMRDYLNSTRSKLAKYEAVGLGDSTRAEALRHLEDKILANLDHRRLFRSGRGMPYLKSNLLRELRADLKRAEIDLTGLDLHAFRVTNATVLRAAGVPEIAIKQRLGHVSIQTTDRHYVDLDRVDTGEGTDAVAKFLGVPNGRKVADRQEEQDMATGGLNLESGAPLRPTRKLLDALTKRYPNVIIGRVFDVSEAAVRKWRKKWGIERRQRQLTKDEMTEADLGILRAEVRMMLARSADDDDRR